MVKLQRSFSDLAPGTYDVREDALWTGWTPTVAPAPMATTPAALPLGAGETVVCVFVNLKQDTIVVEKKTIGGDGALTSPARSRATFAPEHDGRCGEPVVHKPAAEDLQYQRDRPGRAGCRVAQPATMARRRITSAWRRD